MATFGCTGAPFLIHEYGAIERRNNMGAVLSIRKNASWLPQLGVFLQVSEQIVEYLDEPQYELKQLLTSPDSFVYTEICSLDAAQFSVLYEAINQAQESAIAQISQTLEPRVRYTHALCQLKMLLRTDSRLGSVPNLAKLTLTDKIEWSAPDWLYDLVLECLALFVFARDKSLFHQLIGSRVVGGSGHCDLTTLDAEKLNVVTTTFSEVVAYYGDGKGRGFAGPELSQIADKVNQLSSLLV